ncbi:hypothetical protein GCM10027265_20840 [Jatrophihabitans fulvus]
MSRDDRPGSLSALAALVNDVLAARGTRLRPAFAHGPVGFGAGTYLTIAAGPTGGPVGAPSRPRPAPRPTAVAPASTPTDGPDEPSGDLSAHTAADTVDETHVEVWELVNRAQAGDGEAFGLLYDRYVDQVFRFIYYRVNDRALAEDFTSETFLRALRRIGSISYQGRDIGAWFVTIARNIVLDHLKSARNRLETTTGDTIEHKETERSTEAAVLETLQSERLMAAVRQLGDEQRECIMLRFIQGLSVAETAAIMGKNDGAIKALQHRAVRKLADLIGSDLS